MTARTIALHHALDRSGLSPAPAPAGPGTAPEPARPVPLPAADTARYHHPLFVGSAPGRYEGQTLYTFGGFTGRETRPATPGEVWRDTALTHGQRTELDRQYGAARALWSKARLRLLAVPALRKAAPLWQAVHTTRTELDEVFRAFWSTPDGMWRARILALTDAQEAAVAAAQVWDPAGEQLARLAADQMHEAGEEYELPLAEVAAGAGLDITGWGIASAYEYEEFVWRSGGPQEAAVRAEITAQRERLADVARLAGQHMDSTDGKAQG
ncbi:hypothetical protein [Streptomyces tsukubensis]|uniref:hypothetical protein n=1 Tax=Streptomyces tsukubensis TaxID=83656 RepID=UPI00344BE183